MKFLPLVFTLSIGALSLSISTLQAADLMSVYQEALAQDSQYRSARAAYQATQEKLVQGRAGFLPTITLTGSRTVQEVDAGSLISSTTNSNINPAPVTI